VAGAIREGRWAPRPGNDARILTERFMGLISNHLMGLLAVEDLYDPVTHGAEREELIRDLLSGAALDRMMDFFFYGAGALVKEQ
jgi:hypothetical protein